MTQQRIQILHVDDEPGFADLAKEFLERADDRFTVRTVTNAKDGLQALTEDAPDCIVSDYEMPGIDGLEFLSRVRKTYSDLPFILFTGRGSGAVASEAISAGVTDYLQKQASSEQYGLLANRIRNAVAARRETRRANRHKELMRLTELAGDTGGFELNLETEELLLTDGARRLTGLTDATDLCIDDGLKLYPKSQRPEIRQTFSQAAATGEKTHGRWRLQPDGGDERVVDLTFTPVDDTESGGPATTLRGSIHDVTERSDLTEHHQREQQFQTLVERATDIISVINSEGEYQYQSPSIDSILGYDPEETIGDLAWEYIHPDDRERVINNFEHWLQNTDDTAQVVEYRAQHADGSWRWMEARGTGRLNTSDAGGYVTYARDVTDRKQRREELQELKVQYQSLVENFPDGAVILFDTDHTCIQVGGNELDSIGFSADEVEGATPCELFPAPMAEDLCRYYHAALHGDSTTFEQTLNGEQYRIRTAPIQPDDGAIARGIAVFQNITIQAEQRQALERQNQRLDEFASIVSHDLRNPLNIADGYIDLAEGTCNSTHLTKVANAIDRSQALVDDLLTIARTGADVTEPEAVALPDMAGQCWEGIETATAVSGALEVTTAARIQADPDRLHQLLENLYRNALEHGGGNVTVEVGELPDGFYVADDGLGIPKTDRDTVFDPGYSTVEAGTGFGLRIVKQVTDAHGWDVRITDSSAGGAQFEFTDVSPVPESQVLTVER